MKYQASIGAVDTEIRVEREGLYLGTRFLDYADVAALRPINHRVFIDTLGGECIEIAMLGFSYDGFWEELTRAFGARSLEALFVEETQMMFCEGEYAMPGDSGRGNIALYADSVCILPNNCFAVRIPLCFTKDIDLTGYTITITMCSGTVYTISKMGYDTNPFAERLMNAAAAVKQARQKRLSELPLNEPFTHKGLFRTKQAEQYWNAALRENACALEFFTDEDTATYLYRFSETKELFELKLREATEAMGIHREIIYCAEEKIAENPLYRMAVARSEAVSFLRSKIVGRAIHNASHTQRLAEFLQTDT
ncbi:MAG: hypothetical protein IKE65_06545 [Clostridia bacterium]|nr:hypothetical protein [Clostridia bacterium]